MRHKHIVIVAGEASGDTYAAQLIYSLKQKTPALTFSGIGGQLMKKTGATLIYDLAQYGVTGITEVFRHFHLIRKAYHLLKQHLKQNHIDLLILIDYPGFNLRVAKLAKQLGIPVLYYISPQIWAWKAGRIHTIKRNVDKMAVIFPFEKKIYEKYQVPVYYVGHPLVKSTHPTTSVEKARHFFKLRKNSLVIGLMPGSRHNEIRNLLPIMLKAAKQLKNNLPDLEFILPLASSLTKKELAPFITTSGLNIHIIEQFHFDAINCCHSLMVASGTASLEVALLNKPMVIIYKTSSITYAIATQVVKTRFIGLCNLLVNRMLVPELVQHDLTVNNLHELMKKYIDDVEFYQQTKKNLLIVQDILNYTTVDCNVTELVLEMLPSTKQRQSQPFEIEI